ncbi:MAG: hydrogenase formation protein HypD [Firmicutes bacterium]|nr:hydrogenase formation protein HypD [Bacillota bacterium]
MLNDKQKERAQEWIRKIREDASRLDRTINLMEVCGTHTVAIAQHGLRELLPPNVKLLSGPGCPVCVTDGDDIDDLLELAKQPGVTLATFGDLMRVPGDAGNLQESKAQGADVRVVYSTLDALEIAAAEPQRQVVFAGIGFETTAPTVAVSLEQAAARGFKNYSVWSLHKVVPPALKALLDDDQVRIDGFINPGHVCTILGTEPFEFVARDYHRPCVIAGFEANDILETVWMILQQHLRQDWKVEIQYRRAVRPGGNPAARGYLEKVFRLGDAAWRGLGVIPESGLDIAPAYSEWDARKRFQVERPQVRNKGKRAPCLCGAILKGLKDPHDCPSFGQACTPLKPVGPCMVSTEGACAAYYRYQPFRSQGR